MPVYTVENIRDLFSEETREISRIYFEKEARESLLAYLINNSLMDSEGYQRIWLEYIKACADYQECNSRYFQNVVKDLIPKEYKDKNLVWQLDYIKGAINFYE